MKITSVRRISLDDLQRAGEVPTWVDPMLNVINQFIDIVITAMRSNLSFQDNIAGRFVNLEFTHDVEQVVSTLGLTSRVVGIIPMQFGSEKVSSFGWRSLQSEGDGNQIGITLKFDGGTSSTKAMCRIFIVTE